MATPSPSPSPTPATSGVGASPSPSHQPSTKAGALVSSAKTLLSEQSARLALKHTTDLDLLDDLRVYLKTRCSIERDYAQALAKLAASGHTKRANQLLSYVATVDDDSDGNNKTLYTTWRQYQVELEKHAKFRQASFEQLGAICDQLKAMRAHKLQMSKKCLDNHLKKMHEELINSVNEIDKTRKMYFEEEHLARQARDKEEKLKKGKGGIFSSFMNLQNKKERSSAHREASDIQSTQARNDYLMALAAGNAHLEHYYGQDLANLMLTIDDQVLDRVRNFLLAILSAENDVNGGWSEVITATIGQVEKTSADYTNTVFLRDPNSQLLIEPPYYEFQPCDGDPIDTISLDHNADIALKNEGQKWFQWFSKECRNLNRLSAQLVRVQALASEGHRTVEVSGSGQVDIETRIDEIRQQIRKCEVSKLKARARLLTIRGSGAQVEDFEAFETAVAQEIKQQSLDVDLNLGGLSRTPSMRSTSDFKKSENESTTHQAVQVQQSQQPQQQQQQQQYRPESSSSAEQLDSPDREVLQFGSSIECSSPAPTSAAYTNTAASWDAYDPTAAWSDEPAVAPSQPQQQDQQPDGDAGGWSAGDAYVQKTTITEVTAQVKHGELTSTLTTTTVASQELYYDENNVGDYGHEEQAAVDGFALVGKQCYALYTYTAQNEGDLSVQEQDIVNVIEASDKDWVQAQNAAGEYGYLPASYLQAMDDQVVHQEALPVDDWGYEPQQSSMAEVAPAPAAPVAPPPVTQFSESTDISSASGAGVAASAGPTMAKAVYEYVATNDEEISFTAGEMIEIIDDTSDDGWWTGKSVRTGKVGHFPSMLVKEINGDGDESDEEEEDDEEEDEEDEEDEELSEIVRQGAPPPALPPMLPPVLPPPVPAPSPIVPVIVDGGEDRNKQADTPGRPNPPSLFTPPAIGAAAQLIPQAVVIIQPTPEIESKPALGSEEDTEDMPPPPPELLSDDADEAFEQEEEEEEEKSKVNGNTTTTSTATSAAIEAAAREISETITQQAIDDSVRELSRRTSNSSNNTETITVHEMIRENGDIVENGNGEHVEAPVAEEEGDEENFR